jgi:hypothetical protein
MMPTKLGLITGKYKATGSAWAGGVHKGVDLRAPRGEPVFSPWSGKVIGINIWGPAFGDRSPVIDFDNLPNGSPGLWGVMAHLDTCIVKVGQRVAAGQMVGTSGSRGNSPGGPHLHFEVHKNNRWNQTTHVDPQPWLNAQIKSAGLALKQGGKVYGSKMKFGMKDSDSVWNLQVKLIEKKLLQITKPTGNYLDQTRDAVKAFQKNQGWSGKDADGIAGQTTVTRLGLKWEK